ncbi:TPA: F0F1 ATP synthase subunit gamma [Legionella pneumophila]|uniref:ATP synthase gamma chain n=5 Tax=Legionella pneumophila TaxID=446 RepID=ATPG_LEGPH|nr:F0F1 ATP synthase subunit gamma [Legionella pneumophila]A5III4.1 RecName: Full=ATP synthase gamma chain; AltName: Full=ATP synthase F1 sector gamma subunit; AltName: Full=F-ATPase gamma subunit [Legionella pneumophila str. Corby]Q5WSG7.1 RecName: Full=ATP synthase gamma chain; AltName: Full=ATP synthase F1 sector gamma subunit; AltName: Full=F-ATPase gamma subunit [Legionella pneumophila str. Lens]Q5ZRA0.1 RecName: Full=ATP synthase gamma chain; AltName: Full=ATP synthase F1 sector gamma subu
MAGAKEIRSKISSINKTRKITRAMEMVAASKMRKTQERMRASKPYANKIYEVIKHIARAASEYRHPFMSEREIKRIGIIVVTTDRGLCGGLNSNLFRETIRTIRNWQEHGKEVDIAVIGRKGQAFFRRVGGNILGSIDHLGDTPSINDFIGVVKIMLDAYYNGTIDSLHIVYNEFINTMTQKPFVKQLLPLPKSEEDKKTLGHHWDYIYEPEAKELLDEILERYIELQVYQAVVENIACEQAAKMIAMKSATDNAGDLIKEFQLAYNKARQAAITQELAEIVGGAAAL